MCVATVFCLIAPAAAYVADGTSWWNTRYRTSEGTEFWLNYMRNAGKAKGQQDLHLRMYATAREAAHVCVYFNTDTLAATWAPTDSVSFNVPAGGLAGLDNAASLDNLYTYLEDATDQHKAVYVTSSSPVSLYALNYADNSYDASNILPISALGKEHVIQTNWEDEAATEFSITSPYDQNQVTITVLENGVQTQVISRIFSRGDTYIHRGQASQIDLSGTSICSSKPIMVMQGGQNASIPTKISPQSHIFAQSYSSDKWGCHFVVPRTAQQDYDVVRFTAAEDNTEIRRGGSIDTVLNHGGTYEVQIDWFMIGADVLSFTTSKAAYCQLYLSGSSANDNGLGSPALMPIVPLELSLRTLMSANYEFEKDVAANINYIQENYYICVVTPTEGTGTMLIDGQLVNQTLFRPAGMTWRGRPYSYAVVPVSAGVHQLDNPSCSFVAYNYGLARYRMAGEVARPTESYAYSAGSRVERSMDMVIDGAYAWHKSVCVTDPGVSFASLINYDFDSIRWEFPQNSGSIISRSPYPENKGDSAVVFKFRHRYTEGSKKHGDKKNKVPDNDTVLMIVNRTTPVCQYPIKDTIMVLVQVGDTFDIHENFERRPDSVVCVDEAMRFKYWNDSLQREVTVTIHADTLNPVEFNGQLYYFRPNTPYFLDNTLKTHMTDVEGNQFECDSIIHQHFIIMKAESDGYSADLCIKDLPFDTILYHEWKGKNFYRDSVGDWHKEIAVMRDTDTIHIDLLPEEIESLRNRGADTLLTWSRRFETANLCDSSTNITLHVSPSFRFEENLAACLEPGGSFDWEFWEERRGRDELFLITDSGRINVDRIPIDSAGDFIYEIPYVATCSQCNSCDSTYVLNLAVRERFVYDSARTLCSTDTLHWEGLVYMGADYSDPQPDYVLVPDEGLTFHYEGTSVQYGCDSVFDFSICVTPSHLIPDSVTVYHLCDGQSYTFLDSTYTFHLRDDSVESFYFSDTVPTVYACDGEHHCDSVIAHLIYVHPIAHDTVWTQLCFDSATVFVWEGHSDSLYHVEGDSLVSTIFIPSLGDYTFVDTLKSCHYCDQGSCDSIVVLKLAVRPNKLTELTDTICSWALPFEWVVGEDTVVCHSSGVYTDTLLTSSGCDSVVVFDLHVMMENYHEDVYDTVCSNGGLFQFGDTLIDLSLLPTDRTVEFEQSVDYGSCSFPQYLHLVVHPHFVSEQDTVVCQNTLHPDWVWTNVYGDVVRTISIADSGNFVYSDTLQTVYGCDSIFRLNIRVSPSFRFDSVYTICQNERITWMGKRYCGDRFGASVSIEPGNTSDTHQDRISFIPVLGDSVLSVGDCYDTISYVSQEGCDSIYYLKLTVLPQYDIVVDEDVCDTDGFHVFEGTDSWGNSYLDSVFFAPITRMRDSINKDTLFFSRVYRLQSVNGCDSVIYRHLTVHPSYEFVHTQHKCSDDVFTWRGKDYYSEGIYYEQHTTDKWGCDSTYVLYLFVKPVVIVNIDTTICSGDTLFHYSRLSRPNGTWEEDTTIVWVPGMEPDRTYDWHLRYYGGCDSIIYHYTVHTRPSYSFYDEVSLCSNEPYTSERLQHTWDDWLLEYDTDTFVLPFDTVISEHLEAINSCDSSYYLHAHLSPAYRHVDYDTICSDGSYVWRMNMYQDLVPGEHSFIDSLQTVNGCDSLYELRLMVNPAYFIVLHDTICDNGQYAFGSRMLTEEGFYADSLRTGLGCDSIIHLYLTVLGTTADTLYDTICIGDTYYLHNVPLVRPGIYRDTTLNDWGCELYTMLYLEVEEPTVMRVEVPDACADDKVLQLNYSYEGRAPIAFSVHFDDAAHNVGFMDIINQPISDADELSLSILMPSGDPLPMPNQPYFNTQGTASCRIYEPHLSYPQPGTYRVHISWDNGICDPTRIQSDTTFLLRYPSWIHEQHWNDAVLLFTSQYNGGYEWSHIQWMRNGVDIPGETREYLYLPHFLYTSSDDCLLMDTLVQYSARLTRAGDSVEVETCPIIPVQTYDEVLPQDFYYAVVPTLVPMDLHRVNILCNVSGRYRIFSELGTLVASGTFAPCSAEHYAQEVELPVRQGTYLVQLDAGDYGRRTVRIVVTP